MKKILSTKITKLLLLLKIQWFALTILVTAITTYNEKFSLLKAGTIMFFIYIKILFVSLLPKVLTEIIEKL